MMIRRILKKFYFRLEAFFLRFKRTKDVVFFVRNELMLGYARALYQLLATDNRIRFWFCYPSRKSFHNFQNARSEAGGRWIAHKWAQKVKWDLVICPDHAPYFRHGVKKIYTDHGLGSGKIVKDSPYVFGRRSLDEAGKVIYDKIFVSSDFIKEKVRRFYPKFEPHVKVVGSLQVEQVLARASRDLKSEYQQLGLDPNKKTIMLASSWGANSLFQSSPELLISKVNKLMESFNVILSLHILNFSDDPTKGINARDLLPQINKGTVYVTEAQSGGVPYMHLADLLVVDMSSLGLHYPILKRPIIFFNNPNVRYGAHGLVPELRKASYVIDSIDNLENDIDNAFSRFSPSVMAELSEKIASCPGQSGIRQSEEILETLGLSNNQAVEVAVYPHTVPLPEIVKY